MGALSITSSAWLQPVKTSDGGAGAGLSPMDRLWNRLDGMYPFLWRSNFPNDQAVKNWREAWAIAFEAKRITLEEVATGLAACLSDAKRPPTLPEFLELCRPQINPEAAYHEAVEQMRRRWSDIEADRKREAWSHPAIFFAAARFGAELGHSSYNQQKGLWCALLKSAVEDFEGGRNTTVPARREALAAPESKLTPEQRSEMIDRLKKQVGYEGFNRVQVGGFTEQDRQSAIQKVDQALAEKGEL